MSVKNARTEIVVCDVCGRKADRDSWSDGKIDVCSACLAKPHEHVLDPGDDYCSRCQVRVIGQDEPSRRDAWRLKLEYIADAVDLRPEPWQIELAARILSRPYRWSTTGRGDIWVLAQTTAGELGDAMVADGRLDKWGNWPEDDPHQRSS